MAVVTLVLGEPEEDMVGKQDGVGFTRDLVLPEEEVVVKQDGTGCNREYRCSEEDVFRKQDDALRIRIRLPQ